MEHWITLFSLPKPAPRVACIVAITFIKLVSPSYTHNAMIEEYIYIYIPGWGEASLARFQDCKLEVSQASLRFLRKFEIKHTIRTNQRNGEIIDEEIRHYRGHRLTPEHHFQLKLVGIETANLFVCEEEETKTLEKGGERVFADSFIRWEIGY